mmetsp:Transcript_60037/g.177998  ORF Transcript_60037/g.177998 Transcript_60037/m.177998 type:complete len:159 (-) Transcript_60037:4-480(-)
MSTPQSAVVAAGVGATFHLFRLSADLISDTSARQAKEAAAEAEKKKKKAAAAAKDDAAADLSSSKRASTTRIFNGRLSLGGGGGLGASFAKRRSKRESLDKTGRSSLGQGEGGFADEEESAGEGEADGEEPKEGLERFVPTASGGSSPGHFQGFAWGV